MLNKVVLVEDDTALRRSIAQALSYEGLTVIEASAVIVAKDHITSDFDGVVLSDVRMEGRDGFDLLAHVQSIDKDLPVILLTGQGDVPMAVKAMQAGAFDFLEKPCHPETILRVLHRALKQRGLVVENRKLVRKTAENDVVATRFPGTSPIITAFRDELRKMARLPINIHLWGEHGVGKTLSAECIANLDNDTSPAHDLSLATATKDSFEQLDTGRINIFRNVEASSPDQQDMLVSFINAHPETRIVTTSSRPLDVALDEGLSKPLYFLISVAQLEVPPLRSRPQDVLPTFHRLLRRQAEFLRLSIPSLTKETLNYIADYTWPGNVAELRQYATKVLLDLDGDTSTGQTQGLLERLQAYEKTILVDAMQRSKGQVNEVSKELKVPLKTLYDKLKRYEIKGRQFRQ